MFKKKQAPEKSFSQNWDNVQNFNGIKTNQK